MSHLVNHVVLQKSVPTISKTSLTVLSKVQDYTSGREGGFKLSLTFPEI